MANARREGGLTVKAAENLRHDPKAGNRPVRHGDGRGLYLQITPNNAKSWLFRYTLRGKAREMGLGGGDVSLAEARKRAATARSLLAVGIDPIEERRRLDAEKAEARQAQAKAQAQTFRAVAALCIAAEAPGWKNKRTALLWHSSLERHAYPVLGDVPVADVDRTKVREAISGVWASAPSIGKKVLRRIATVLRFAAANGWRANDNPADARMLRHAGLPALPGGRRQPSLPWAKVPAFMEALAAIPGASALALRFAVLSALRSGEVRQLRWSWLSFDGTPTLTIPGEVMKGKRSAEVQPHRVPLSLAALDVLAAAYSFATATPVKATDLPRLASLRGDTLVFPSTKRDVPLSDMALSSVMRRMNVDRPKGTPAPWRDADGRDAVPHGFRATFSTWVDDTRPEEREAAERALAHEVANKVSGAYRRSDLFDRRIGLMAAWADHCTRPTADLVSLAGEGARRAAKAGA